MSIKDQICDHCGSVILSLDDSILLTKGYFNKYKLFSWIKDNNKVYHSKCFTKIWEAGKTMLLQIEAITKEVKEKSE
jgi:hypothetical protein